MKKSQLHALLQQMTLDEKVAQLLQLSVFLFKGREAVGDLTGPMKELNLTDELLQTAGSGLGGTSKQELMQVQKEYIKSNRLGIPLLFMADIIHGYKTVFPIPLALGCSFNEEAMEAMAEVSALEGTADGHHVTFSPMVDLVRDPRWGRVMESTGEDPFLNSKFAAAAVRGYQGNVSLDQDFTHMAACVKHFAAYGVPQAGREYNTVDMSWREFYQSFLPSYQAAIKAGVKLVMTAFNLMDGVPCTMNRRLNRDILRGELGFSGVLISDWGAVKEEINHGTAVDTRDAAECSIKAGVDIEMMSECYRSSLKELVESADVDLSLVDEAVLRILTLKNELGLFEDPYRGLMDKNREADILSKENRKKARWAANESAVLLKNDSDLLPISVRQKIALIGPLADSKDVLGAWVLYGKQEDAVSVFEGLKDRFQDMELVATGYTKITDTEFAQAEQAAKNADLVVLCLGEKSEWSGEASSLSTIRLPHAQYDLARYIKGLGVKVVTILFNGRPLDIRDLAQDSDALLDLFFPGTEAGNSVFDLLTGQANPSGKLSMTFPYTTGQIPIFYNQWNTGRPKVENAPDPKYLSQYLDIPNEPLFPFGFGLSYTNFEVSDIQMQSQIALGETLPIQLTVKNTGKRAGQEVVQIYLQDVTASVSRPVKELKAFQKVKLEAGEEARLNFDLAKEAFSFYKPDLTFVQEPGLHRVFIGTSSVDVQTFEVRVV